LNEANMTFPPDPHDRIPRGDKNRRVSLGIDRESFARTIGVTAEELREYEFTQPDHNFDIGIARRVGPMLDRLEILDTRSHSGPWQRSIG
jgi:hypothetical protein